MNRKEEYLKLLSEIDNTPEELACTVARAQQKLQQERRHNTIKMLMGSVASFAVLFVILVNSSIAFAHACGKIPGIKELAELVAFSPSLSAAVENKYVQPIELEQTKNGITARVEYVIVDQKQLNVFYSLDSEVYNDLEADSEVSRTDGGDLEGYGMSTGSFGIPNGELRQITVDFLDENMPRSMQLTLNVHASGNITKEEQAAKENLAANDEEHSVPEYISEFGFSLEFDPNHTATGETIILNQSFEIDGQKLTATTIEIYPTHIRLNFVDDKENTAWLKAMEFYLENEKGKHYEAISNGITATGSMDSPMMESHRLESPFFSKSKSLRLRITGVTWLDKNMEKVRIDLKNKTAQVLPQNVRFEKATRHGDDWTVEFSAKEYKENASYQIWMQNYYDEQGNEYSYNSWSSRMCGYFDEERGKQVDRPGRFSVEFELNNYPHDEVYLSPAYSRIVKLNEPIEIKVK